MVYDSIIGHIWLWYYHINMWYDGQNHFIIYFKLQNRPNDQPGWNALRLTYWIPWTVEQMSGKSLGLNISTDLRGAGGGSAVENWIIHFPQKYNLLQGHYTNQIFVWKYKLRWSQRLHWSQRHLLFEVFSHHSTRVFQCVKKKKEKKKEIRHCKESLCRRAKTSEIWTVSPNVGEFSLPFCQRSQVFKGEGTIGFHHNRAHDRAGGYT